MQLFILRHGDAPYGVSDGERALSGEGVLETRRVVNARLDELSKVEHIVCSPVLRARQTMDVLSCCLKKPKMRITFEDCLKSESSIGRVSQFMSLCPEQATLLVTHQPLVGQLVNYLEGSQRYGSMMGTSWLAAFDVLGFAPGGATLQWLDSPIC